MVVDSGRESKKYLSENYMVDYMTLARARGRLPSICCAPCIEKAAAAANSRMNPPVNNEIGDSSQIQGLAGGIKSIISRDQGPGGSG